MPEQLKQTYQYYTKAEMTKLREAGYDEEFVDVYEGTRDYVTHYLEKEFEIY